MDYAPWNFQYPTTRYSGGKRRLLDWIWEHVKDIRFQSALDVFGGTGSVSMLFKRHGKRVLYNDLLKCNQIVGTALIENDRVIVTEEDVKTALQPSRDEDTDFIQREFQGVFFLNEENAWLDKMVTNIMKVTDQYKRAILMSALFQACLTKRPFNLFHRANLYLRTASVKRTFGNKTTWERPFPELFERYVNEYNRAIFSNGQRNRVIGGYDALSAPNGVDLVYLDPPYFSATSSRGTNYLAFYHFLEGLADYENWAFRISSVGGKIKRFPDSPEISRFTKKTEIISSFTQLIEHFQDSIIVLSYQNEGIPSEEEIVSLLRGIGKRVRVFRKPHRYVLSSKTKEEMLFITD